MDKKERKIEQVGCKEGVWKIDGRETCGRVFSRWGFGKRRKADMGKKRVVRGWAGISWETNPIVFLEKGRELGERGPGGYFGESEKQSLNTSKSGLRRHSRYVHCELCIFSFWILFCLMSLWLSTSFIYLCCWFFPLFPWFGLKNGWDSLSFLLWVISRLVALLLWICSWFSFPAAWTRGYFFFFFNFPICR